jgi:hypothetical protein
MDLLQLTRAQHEAIQFAVRIQKKNALPCRAFSGRLSGSIQCMVMVLFFDDG